MEDYDYDRVCDLECTGQSEAEQAPNRHEFVGPVKIVLVESTPEDYRRKVWGSAIFTLVMLLLGATTFTMFFYTLKFKLPFAVNVHVILCTIGFQLFMTTGIMMFSTLFGGSLHLKPAARKFQHFFLEIFAVFFGCAGTLFVLPYMALTAHAVSGALATGFSLLSCLVVPAVCCGMFGNGIKRVHRCVSVFTFILCTVCFCLGLMKESFINSVPVKYLHYIILSFSVTYSLTTLYYMRYNREF